MSEDVIDTIYSLCVGDVISQTCIHNFAEGQRFEAIPWNGKFEKRFVKRKAVFYEICYCESNNSYDENGEDYEIPLYQLVTDVITGDLVFCDF